MADDAKAVSEVAGDLDRVSQLIDQVPDVERLIRSPVLARAEQGRAMEAILEDVKVGELTRRFVGVLARNRRLFVLPDIIRAYRDILAARRGETTAEVVTAVKLSEAQAKAVGAALKSAEGGNVSIVEQVDPTLLGGMIVKIGSRMVDSSLRTKLQRLRLAMKGVG